MRRNGLVLFLAAGLLALPWMQGSGQSRDLGVALTELRSGRYQEAIDGLRALSAHGGRAPSVGRTLGRALMEVGRYQEAVEALVGGSGVAEADPAFSNVLGEALYALGRVQEAEALFQRALEGGASDRNVAKLNLGILQWNRGEREEALALFDSFIDLYNRSGSTLSAEDLMAVGRAVSYLGVTNPALYQDALMAFTEASELAPRDPRPHLLAGELFLDKYRATDARESFKVVLTENPRNPRALLGQARILDFEGAGGSVALVREALEVNPRYADARVFLAELFLRTENLSRAREEALEALEINPVHLGALSVLASTHYLEEDLPAYEELVVRVRSLNPSYARLFTAVAEAAVAKRQYASAVELAKRAVEVDSLSWRSYGILGMNQLRTGAVEEGRKNLEIAFEGDPYNPWYKNSLDLLDTFVRYEEVVTENFRIFLHEREAALLAPYITEMAEEAFGALQARYRAAPPTPIRLEVYPSHADFSVRTLGLAGLGALGVSFGSTLVMDSPSAKDPGEFNWVSTAWHEIAHAFHLAMTEHRVPRWFTEGLAVHEQRKARPRWGYKASPGWLQAYESGRLLPVSRLNQGFIRPEYPEQVVFSYYQASLVFELIESRWGLDAILAMLDGYRRGESTEGVFQDVLGQSLREFDGTFDQYVRERWGPRMEAVAAARKGEGVRIFHREGTGVEAIRLWVAENPGNFLARLALGKALFEEERLEEARSEFRTAVGLFPEYGGRDSPYLYLARIHLRSGEKARAARALQQMGQLNETVHEVHLQEAGLRLELGDSLSAVQALEKAVEIAPFQVEPHELLAELYERLGMMEGAVRERRAILALDPTDRADAHFRLAGALANAGSPGEARSQLLRALEIAPSFEAALELLLELKDAGGGGSP
jgi:tetratricopeptide (TPR) repeat protein